MAFRPLSERAVRWRPEEGEGLEYLHLRATPGGIVARSVVIGERGGQPYGASYEITCDREWRVLSFAVATTDGRRLALCSDGHGAWVDAAGGERSDLAGCIDIDLSGTPFTNTLPIRRLDLTPEDGPAELRVLYVPFGTFAAFPDHQRYRAIGPGLIRYEAMDRSFTADLPVDEDGLVLDYPGLFRRV